MKKGFLSITAQRPSEALKQAMTIIPVPELPGFSQPSILQTDASYVGIDAFLLQLNHPIAYFSKIIPSASKFSTYIRELYAITAEFKK